MKIGKEFIYFDDDQEFYDYAVIPNLKVVNYVGNDGSERYHTDFDLSSQYFNALNNGMTFVIKDPNSQIYKHGCVSYRTISKPIENLFPWIGFEYEDEDLD